MSMAAVRWVLEFAPRHGGPARAALVALAWHADDHGANAYPSQSTWARKAGLSERSLRRVIADLEAEGSIERDGHQPGGGTVKWRLPAFAATLDGPANGGRTTDADRADAGPANVGRPVRPTVAESVRPTLADKQSLNGPEQSELPSAAGSATANGPSPFSASGRTDVAREASPGHPNEDPEQVRATIRQSLAHAANGNGGGGA